MRTFVIAAFAVMAAACTPAPLTGDALIARGDYLVNGVVLCGDCHTPRLENGASDETRALHGAPLPGPPGFAQVAPPLAGIPTHYTAAQFESFLQTGVRPDGSHPLPPMPPYRLNEQDARAVAAYIATLPRAETPATP
jgi:cytochrome c553